MHACHAPGCPAREMFVTPRDQAIRVELTGIMTNWQIERGNRLRQQRLVHDASGFAGVVLAGAFTLKLAKFDPAIADIDGHQVGKYASFMHDSHSRQLARIPVANRHRTTQLEPVPRTR